MLPHERGVQAEITAASICHIETRTLADIDELCLRFANVVRTCRDVVIVLPELFVFAALCGTDVAS